MTRNAIVVTVLAVAGVVALLAGPLRLGAAAEPPRRRSRRRRHARRPSTSIAWCARIRTTGRPLRRGWSIATASSTRARVFTASRAFARSPSKPARFCAGTTSTRKYFAEGLSEWGETLVQLTWTTGVAFAYDRETFKEVRRFAYTGEGWGLTRTDRHLVMSDGSATLKLLDPSTFAAGVDAPGARRARARHRAERAGDGAGRDLRQRVAVPPHRDDRAGFGNGHRVAGSDGSAAGVRARSCRCPQWHRVR